MRSTRPRIRVLLPLSLAIVAAVPQLGDRVGRVHAASVPAGFVDEPVASFGGSTAVEWLPNSRIVVLEQSGRVNTARPGEAFSTALDLDVCQGSERGLLGFTHDPGFLGNGFVYVYYTRDEPGAPGGCVNRVSRFTMSGATIDPANEVVLLDHISSVNGNHNGGDLDVGSDGFLYVAVGDAGRDPRGDSGSAGGNDAAQDLSLLNGKILRITLDGAPAPGNPLTGPDTARCAFRGNTTTTPPSTCQEIFAWGVRNPYRIAFDRNDGADRFHINDVGQVTYEEVDVGELGANYGWPVREGFCAQGDTQPCAGAPPEFTDPLLAYGRSEGTYVTAGAFIPDGSWPGVYDGAYFYADGGSGRIWYRIDDGTTATTWPFAEGTFGISDMTFGYDTAGRMVLYYVLAGDGLRSITPTAPPRSVPSAPLTLQTTTPFRAYDTGDTTIGGPAGDVFNGTTRRVTVGGGDDAVAALVNITMADTAGPGFIRTWIPGGLRPETSSVNADTAGAVVANAVVVALEHGEFILESSTTARVIVDVMGYFTSNGPAHSSGRVVTLPPLRLADTRLPAGETIEGGSPNPWSRSGDTIEIDVAGHAGIPDPDSIDPDDDADAVVLSLAAIASPDAGGFVGAYPAGGTWGGTSNVNILPADVRANLVVSPLGSNGAIAFQTKNVEAIVVDVIGWVTGANVTSGSDGLLSLIDPVRIVDTRVPVGFGRLAPLSPSTVATPAAGGGIVQTITATNTGGAGWVATHPDRDEIPLVSSLNYTTSEQTRAVLAFSRVSESGTVSYTSMTGTDLVVDVVGVFSD